jgi:hypothetical protein
MDRVAVVGCGFSGLYASYRILQRKPETKITIYEKSPKIGGRIITSKKQGHILEYGPMRFEPDLQPNFAKLIKELDIETKTFAPYSSPMRKPDYNAITHEEIQAIESEKTSPPSFVLMKLALKKILDQQWDVDVDDIADTSRDKNKTWLKSNATFQGEYLYNMGIWDVFAHVLSKPAIEHIMFSGTFYHIMMTNANAADVISFMLDMLVTHKSHLYTITGGSELIIDRLYRKVRDYVQIDLDTEVLSVDDQNGAVDINHSKGGVCAFDHVFITSQKSALDRIQGLPPHITSSFRSVCTIGLYKIFVILDNPPWGEHDVPVPNFNAHLVPCREVHYYFSTETKTGMVMLYGDVPSLNYWSSFVQRQGEYYPEHNNNPRLKNHLRHYLQLMFPLHRYFSIIDYGIMDWSAFPNETGIHMWKPKYKSSEIADQMSHFGRQGQLHICGETFSTYQGFIEGCIRSVDMAMKY